MEMRILALASVFILNEGCIALAGRLHATFLLAPASVSGHTLVLIMS